jgi:molybdenum cofactor cytidylyltransferase
MRVAGLVLGAGSSKRLGEPKQLLPYKGGTLLGHVVGVARSVGFDQLVVTVREGIDVADADTVTVDASDGCSTSIRAGLEVIDADVLVLMLGDQPGVTAATVHALLDGRGDASLALCRYDDGLGHPIAFTADRFDELRALHGDKGVWKMVDRGAREVRVPGSIPMDVDTRADYEAVLCST